MVYVRFSRRLVWFFSALVYFSSSVTLSSRVSVSENLYYRNYSRNDKNWWFWNQESKEKPDNCRRKQINGIDKLDFKRSVHPFKPDMDPLRSLFSKEPLRYLKVKKRWLSGTFGLCGRKKHHKESQKWLIDSRRSGRNSLPTTPVFRDPWMVPRKRMQVCSNDFQTNDPHRKYSAWHRIDARKHGVKPKKLASHQTINHHDENNLDSILFGSANVYRKGNGLPSIAHRSEQITRFPEQRLTKYLKPSLSAWNKSHDPVWDRYMTPFRELKLNPLSQPYPFHDPRSTIKWYTTPHYGGRTSEPPLDGAEGPSDNRYSPWEEGENRNNDEIIENKGLARSKNKKIAGRGRPLSDCELIPKAYALNQLRNGKKSNQKYSNDQGCLENSIANPIIVPGFKRTEAPDEEYASIRPYIIRTEERNFPFDDDEFIQVSRANRNQSRNYTDGNKLTSSSIPMQLPSPYAFPGGVNISILVPNPPAPPHETPLSTMTATSTDKHSKKKKERKKKGKNDELIESLLSEPKSLVSTHVHRKFPYTEKTAINPLIGDDDRQIKGMKPLNYGPLLNYTTGIVKPPIFDLKTDNFSLLSHIRNLTLNQLEGSLLGVQNDEVKKPFEAMEDDDDDDEIHMLYDEQTSSTKLRSLEEPYGQTVSFSWYRLTDDARGTSGIWDVGKFSTPSDLRRIPGIEFGGSGSVTPGRVDDKYLNYSPKRIHSNWENRHSFGHSMKSRQNDKREAEAIHFNRKYDVQIGDSKLQNYYSEGRWGSKGGDREPTDQWDALDEDLKSDMSENGKIAAWRVRNRKRETDYYDRPINDEQGYYRLSFGGNSLRNPTNLIMSAFRAKPNKQRDREYYDDASEEKAREQMRPSDVATSSYPK